MCPKKLRFQNNECRDLINILRKVYMSLIRPIVTYAREIWALSIWVTNNLLVFERQILRKIFGPIQCEERWRVQSNKELQKLIK
jgi:hypothetical protein